MENVIIQNKVKLLFKKISEPQYVMNNYYADHFFIKLNSSDPDVTCLKTWPVTPDLLIEALDHMDTYHDTVKVFIIRMLGVISEGELQFSKIFCKKGDVIAKAFSEINSPNIHSSLRVAYMEVALSLINHNSGIYWILESGAWKEFLSLCNEKRTVFVVRQTYKFAALFLWKLNSLGNEPSIKMILSFIIKPLTDNDYLRIESLSCEEEDILCKTLEPMFQILLAIVSYDGHIKTQNCILSLMLKDLNVITYSCVVLDRLRREDMILVINKLLFWLTIGKMFCAKPMTPNLEYNREDLMELTAIYFNTVQRLIQRRSPTLIFDFCNACNIIWAGIWKNSTPTVFEIDGRKVELQKQLLLICLVPSVVYAFNGRVPIVTCDSKVQDYVTKMLNSSCEHTARTAYALRDLIMQLDTQATTLQSVKRLSCLKDHLNNEQANLVFQTLFYILQEYDPLDEHGDLKNEINLEDDQEKVVVMTYVLDTLLALVKNYNINWQESLEVLCLYSVVFNTLKRSNLSCKFVVTALNVITLTVKKFLPPNLSLLLDSKPGSSMHELGKLIYMKMHDYNWEVRDSALELLYVCTDISFIKFPPFQKQILSNNLISVAATMALNDHEFYVRVSALKCLGAASKVATLWEQLVTEHPMQDHLLSIVSNNQEGIVRKEACNVLCEIYQNVKLNRNFKTVLFDHMVSSALCDFHWEVQLSALKFWKIVIQSLLNDQGMLDGTFPPVTFSRETRKIVTLNEVEIQRRLIRVLEELSSIGCLTVLIKLLHDDAEVGIMDTALEIATELLDILDRFKVPERLVPAENEPKSVDDLLNKIKLDNFQPNNGVPEDLQSFDKADNVIESILNADDINLLANIYERHMSLQATEPEPIKIQSKLLKFASPYMFVSYLRSRDFKKIIEEKKNWKDGIKSLSSLLDDVLGIYEVNDEINALDCY